LPITVKKFAEINNISIFVIMSAIFAMNLYIYSQQSMLVIGYPTNQRPKAFAELIGYFVNLLPLPLQLTPQSTLHDIIMMIKQHRKTVTENNFDACPMLDIAKSVGVFTSSNASLFNVMISPTAFGELCLPGVQIETLPVDTGASLCEMLLLYELKEAAIHCAIEYKPAVFSESLVKKFILDLQQVAEYLLQLPTEPLHQRLFKQDDKQQLAVSKF
jgi:non-ribosomal peptide synthetase component F